MTILELGCAVESWAPFFIALNHLCFKDRAIYFGLDPMKPYIRQSALRIVIPLLYLSVLFFIAYCTYLNHWA